jgi:hypothetical protein
MSDLFATVPLPPSGPEREALMRDAILVGSQEEFFSYLPQTAAREEAEQRLADQEERLQDQEQQQAETRACAAQILSDGVTRLCARLDVFEKQRALSAKRAEAERQRRDRQRVQSYLAQLPDPDDPDLDDPTGILPPAQDPTGSTLEMATSPLNIRDTDLKTPSPWTTMVTSRSSTPPIQNATVPRPMTRALAICHVS